jgi:NAD(P)-dependent dehydrogenase (short-subunit alcohol dehydrogenase family)
MLAKQMARELAVHGIRVNVVAPGIVRAGLAGELLKTDPVYTKRAGKVVPLGEFQTASQVADVVGFLCSAAGEYITGTVLLADGGCSLFQFDSDINSK